MTPTFFHGGSDDVDGSGTACEQLQYGIHQRADGDGGKGW